jgi:hypothetical protein
VGETCNPATSAALGNPHSLRLGRAVEDTVARLAESQDILFRVQETVNEARGLPKK